MDRATVAGVEVDTRHWIGGRRVASPITFPDVSPIDGQTIADISRGGAEEVDAAVTAASEAFRTWSRTRPEERAAILHRIADGVEKRTEELAQVETRDNGSLLRSHRRGVMPRVALNFRFFADHLLRLHGELRPADWETRGHRNHVTWDPAGVTAVITPWNAPLMLASWRIAPALAAGNTVVAKPPEWAPLTASLLADIAAEAGLPDGAFNVVQGMGTEAGAPLVADPRVRRISFTGSVPTAQKIGAAAAENVTPVSFELGGKSPLLVMEDADLDLAVAVPVTQQRLVVGLPEPHRRPGAEDERRLPPPTEDRHLVTAGAGRVAGQRHVDAVPGGLRPALPRSPVEPGRDHAAPALLLEVQVRAVGVAAVAERADHRSLVDALSHCDDDAGHVGVERIIIFLVVDEISSAV